MNNFIYHNPVKVIFGVNTIPELRNLIPLNKKILITYGGGSIKKNGIYEQVISALENHQIHEFSGIEPNPAYETCMKAVEVVKKHNIDFLLAVGGGSIVDATKFISAAAKFEDGDPWKILSENAEIKTALPLGSVITVPASGSETNCIAVVSRRSTAEKIGFRNPKIQGQFTIIDPSTTYSLPENQLLNGVVDTYVHVLEEYLTCNINTPLQDRQAEAILLTLHEIAQDVIHKKNDYESRANFFWCATQALNGLIACGTVSDWSTHYIGLNITAFYGLEHAKTIAIVLPELLKYKAENKKEKILQYGKRILRINNEDNLKTVYKIIDKLKMFFNSLGMKTKLVDYNIDSDEAAEKISARVAERKAILGEKNDINPEDVKKILKNC